MAAVSGDGTTLVGESEGRGALLEPDVYDTTETAMLWVAGSGMVPLVSFGSASKSAAGAVNFDGSVIWGWLRTNVEQNGIRWTPGAGLLEYLGDVTVTGSNEDGSILSAADGRDALRWQQATGLVRLEPLAGLPDCSAEGISADGTALVGYCSSASTFVPHAVRWTAGGPLDLGTPPGASDSRARAVSADGSAVVGWGTRDEVDIAFRWTEQTGMVALDTAEISRAVSADGSVVVGNAGNDGFLWTAGRGVVPLSELLPPEVQVGTAGARWELVGPQGISADGTVIAGVGNNPKGAREGWRITLGAECLQ